MKKYLNTHTILLITLIISINILSGYLNINIDLTSDKLHSISSETKNIINKLDDRIFIKVYLEGEFPAEFKHLQNATYNLLKRFISAILGFQYFFSNLTRAWIF